jgi:rhodanese-related sulfurtransferase
LRGRLDAHLGDLQSLSQLEEVVDLFPHLLEGKVLQLLVHFLLPQSARVHALRRDGRRRAIADGQLLRAGVAFAVVVALGGE